MNKIYIPWKKQSDLWWNDVCAKLVEHFGTPGEKYTTSTDEDYMTIDFKDKKDHLMCKMLLSEHIVDQRHWTLPVGDNGEVTLNDEILNLTGWREGDTLEFVDLNNGSWQIQKKTV